MIAKMFPRAFDYLTLGRKYMLDWVGNDQPMKMDESPRGVDKKLHDNNYLEEPLIEYGSCNLSSVNLSEFVINPFTENAKFNYDKFNATIKNLVIYMNEILDEAIENNLYPLPQQTQAVIDYRTIGVGKMGFADALIKMGIRYGSKESLDLADKIGFEMINSALQQSALLAKEKGTFPKYKKEAVLKSPFLLYNAYPETLELVEKYGLYNHQLLTIAPNGSISTLLGISGGVEPHFNLSFIRKTESLRGQDTYYKVFTPIAKEYMEKFNIEKEEDLPDFFVTAMTLNHMERVDMQSVWQTHIDASISSTVNVPNEFTVEQVEELYMYAWKKGLKGLTIYRDGCSRGGILLNTKPKENRLDKIDKLKSELDQLALEELKDNPDQCPLCGGHLIHSGGCEECQDCGYSPCSI